MIGDGEEKWKVSQLLFADDTVLVAYNKKLDRLLEDFGRASRRRKLEVNAAKSKVMRSARDGNVEEMKIMMDDQVLEEVEVFTYLMSLLTAVGGIKSDVQQNILEGSK